MSAPPASGSLAALKNSSVKLSDLRNAIPEIKLNNLLADIEIERITVTLVSSEFDFVDSANSIYASKNQADRIAYMAEQEEAYEDLGWDSSIVTEANLMSDTFIVPHAMSFTDDEMEFLLGNVSIQTAAGPVLDSKSKMRRFLTVMCVVGVHVRGLTVDKAGMPEVRSQLEALKDSSANYVKKWSIVQSAMFALTGMKYSEVADASRAAYTTLLKKLLYNICIMMKVLCVSLKENPDRITVEARRISEEVASSLNLPLENFALSKVRTVAQSISSITYLKSRAKEWALLDKIARHPGPVIGSVYQKGSPVNSIVKDEDQLSELNRVFGATVAMTSSKRLPANILRTYSERITKSRFADFCLAYLMRHADSPNVQETLTDAISNVAEAIEDHAGGGDIQ